MRFTAKFFALAFWLIVGIIPATSQTFGIFLNPGGTTIRVINNSDDATRLKIIVGDKTILGNFARGAFTDRFFAMGYNGEVPVTAYTCSQTPLVHALVYPPEWTMTLPTNIALDEDYIKSNPSEPALKKRIDAIENSLNHQLGRKQKIAELKDWFRRVQATGIQYEGTGCVGMKMINAKVAIPLDYSGYKRVVEMIIRGNATNGYRVEGPIWISN